MTQPGLIGLRPNNMLKEYITIHLHLIYIDARQVVILLMIYPVKYVF